MIHISRTSKPGILSNNEINWLRKFIESGKPRPHHSQYAHPDIKDALMAMSGCKCFYCETLLKNSYKEVDHFIEVSIDKNLAFNWENLYLACENCNNKMSHNDIPVESVLDPCKSDDEEIEKHLQYEDEIIDHKVGSTIGELSIRKYKLDSELLDNRRRVALTKFLNVLVTILGKMNNEQRDISDAEREILIQFSNRNKSYSFMFKFLLKKHGII